MFLKELIETFGVSGYEKEVSKLIEKAVSGYADEITRDSLGNLIVFKRGTGERKKKIMLAAHMDEIGLQVIKIDERGFIKFKDMGYNFPSTLYMSRIRFRNGVIGLVSTSTGEDKPDITKMHIDIGAKSKEDALKYVKVGDVAGYIGEYCELLNGNIMAKAMDDRLGCHILVETLQKTETLYNDVYFVFTVQEELGCRGSKVTARRLNPDIGIAVDVTPAHDYPCDLEGSNTLGDGAAIKVADPSVVCDEYLIGEMVKCCGENNIKFQYDVINKGGTDASSINTSNYGVRVGGVSIPLRYPHGHSACANKGDVEACTELLRHFINRSFEF